MIDLCGAAPWGRPARSYSGQELQRFEEAIAAYQDADAILTELGDRHREGIGLKNLGLALQELRRFEEAIAAREQAAATFRETNDDHLLSVAQKNLAEDRQLHEEG
ncbi:hypothetical protein [Nonomuraea typhae]|uniref:Tetratricopeptide repeat protein n=1 Tax=Nonomuraea typhae TaxID=2603600 RepID=A0ABW7Z9A6_9ACTN